MSLSLWYSDISKSIKHAHAVGKYHINTSYTDVLLPRVGPQRRKPSTTMLNVTFDEDSLDNDSFNAHTLTTQCSVANMRKKENASKRICGKEENSVQRRRVMRSWFHRRTCALVDWSVNAGGVLYLGKKGR